MAIRLDIKSQLPQATKWTNQHTKQLPFSIAQAINASVQGSKFIAGSKQKSALNRLAGSSRRYLDRPKKQTQKGFRATVARKATLTSVIMTKDRPYNMGRYIDQNIFGGDRKQKYDALFVNHPTARNLPTGAKLVPTRFLDKHNFSEAKLIKKECKIEVLKKTIRQNHQNQSYHLQRLNHVTSLLLQNSSLEVRTYSTRFQ